MAAPLVDTFVVDDGSVVDGPLDVAVPVQGGTDWAAVIALLLVVLAA